TCSHWKPRKWGAGLLNLVFWVQFSRTGHWIFNMVPHGKTLSEDVINGIIDLHKDGLGYKINTQKLSCSMVAKVIVIQDRFHSEQASPRSTKDVESTCSATYPEVGLKK
uniref:Uncharacterized protein n=1 Tax=Pygocentrus nattereri TaxID=42514 RepID=A0AAR2M442_PYGNA